MVSDSFAMMTDYQANKFTIAEQDSVTIMQSDCVLLLGQIYFSFAMPFIQIITKPDYLTKRVNKIKLQQQSRAVVLNLGYLKPHK